MAKGSHWGFNALVSETDRYGHFPAHIDAKFWNLRNTKHSPVPLLLTQWFSNCGGIEPLQVEYRQAGKILKEYEICRENTQEFTDATLQRVASWKTQPGSFSVISG